MSLKAAVVQMTSSTSIAQNLTTAANLIAEACQAGAKLIVLPEEFALLPKQATEKLAVAEQDNEGPIQLFLSEQAKIHNIYLVGGSIPLQGAMNNIFASCLVFAPDGKRIARYDKIHLFDVFVEDNTSTYQESALVTPGHHCQTASIEGTLLGLSVCYDLRFPELYRELATLGAEIFVAPSAFTKVTGQAHWHILLRARAIENLSFMLAANQTGDHENGRQTYGHSCIISPWGEILAEAMNGEGTAIADIDLSKQKHLRSTFPVLSHRRL